MKLGNDAIAEFECNGLLILPKLFAEREVDNLIEALEPLLCEDTPANIREKSSGEVRTAMGLHLRSELYSRLVQHPRLIEPAAQIRYDPFVRPVGPRCATDSADAFERAADFNTKESTGAGYGDARRRAATLRPPPRDRRAGRRFDSFDQLLENRGDLQEMLG